MWIQDFGEGGLVEVDLIKPRLPKPHLSVGKINAVKGANKSWLEAIESATLRWNQFWLPFPHPPPSLTYTKQCPEKYTLCLRKGERMGVKNPNPEITMTTVKAVCTCACVHVCICARECTCMCACACACVSVCVCVCAYVCVCTCVSLCASVRVCMCESIV